MSHSKDPNNPEYAYSDIKTILSESQTDADHLLWVICAMGVEMGFYREFFEQFQEWQDAISVIRDRALWLYESFNNETVDMKTDWDWYLKIEETAKKLAAEVCK